MIRAAVLAVLLVPAAVIGLDTPLVMADSHLPAGAFVTTWNATASQSIISIPVEVHTDGTLTIDWGDGTPAAEVTTNGTQSHTYSASDEYRVSMTGDLSRIILGNIGSTASKLVSIDQWGDIEWSSMKDAFAYTSNMKYNASDVPNLSGVSSMENMFNLASKFDGDLSEWNVSAVTYMRSIFLQASSFNGNVSTWNVAAVTDMNSMFHSASDFNGDISNWNVSAVTNMNGMFSDASAFNGDISSWNVAAVTSMNNMFSGAFDFNGDISSWNVAAVTIMNGMFSDASAFNGDISEWDVSAVTSMNRMFLVASAFNQPLNSWNVSSVTNMDFMFLNADDFEQNLGEWYILPAEAAYDITDASLNVTVISAQNSILDGHDPTYGIDPDDSHDSGLFNMTGSTLMFKATPSAGTYTVNVTAPGGDFGTNNHRVLDITVEGQDDSTVSADAFVTTWNVTASPYTISIPVRVHTGGTLTIDWGDGTAAVEVTTNGIHSYTYSASGEYQVSMTGDLSRIILGAPGGTSGKLASIDQWGDIEWSSMKDAFSYTYNMKYNASDVPNLSGVSSMENMFNLASKFDGDLSEWNVSAVTYMRGVFAQTLSFNGDVSTWNVSAVTDMKGMFFSASTFNGDISSWNVSAVTNMNGMFSSAYDFNGDISSWNVSAVTDMHSMFSQASKFNQPLNNWNVSAVTDMTNMFSGASTFNGDISSWNVSAVTDMRSMFSGASSFNQPLNDWNVSAVFDMIFMFSDTTAFERNLGKWYVVPADTDYDAATETSLVITTIAAQNIFLGKHTPNYGIGTGGNSTLFNMTGSNLVFKDTTPSAGTYTVNVTAPGGIFGTNNHHVFDITVTGDDHPLLVNAGPDQRVLDESEVTLLGTVSDSDSTDPTYSWTQNSGSPAVTLAGSDTLTPTFTAPDVSSDVDLVFTLTVDDGTETDTDTVTVTVHDAEADFVTTWDIIGIGTTLPIRSSAGSFTVDWGDGKISESAAITTDRSLAHLYDIPGTYAIRISGNFSGIFLQDNPGVAGRMQSIDQWGDIKWTTMAGAFYHAVNMIYNAIDVPDLSSVTDMSFMFARTGFSSGDLSGWNVSGVTDMSNMFLSSGYTGDLSGWDVSSVTDMQNMFSGASSFDSDLSSWNVSAVTYMDSMFLDATSFDSDLSGWNVSSVTGMRSMFSGASSFNSDLSEWDVSAVLHMDDMFSGASSFEQNLGEWYVVPADTVYDAATETTLVVTAIAAQNSFLNDPSPNYGIGTGGNSTLFSMPGSNLTFKDTPPSAGTYTVNVTAPGGSFGTNNHHVFDITVTGEDHPLLVNAGPDQRVLDESAVTLSGTVSDSDSTDPTYLWTQNSGSPAVTLANSDTLTPTFTAPDVSSDVDLVFTLTVDDGTDTVTDTVTVTVHDAEADFVTTWSDITTRDKYPDPKFGRQLYGGLG